jgi:predicted nucleic acid-binding Zn ribbon protein
MQLRNITDIIKKVQERYPAFSKRLAEAEALGRWDLAVGPLIAKHTRVLRVQNAVLVVEVDHPIWRSELHYRKQQILDILNGKTPSSLSDLKPLKQTLSDLYFTEVSEIHRFGSASNSSPHTGSKW